MSTLKINDNKWVVIAVCIGCNRIKSKIIYFKHKKYSNGGLEQKLYTCKECYLKIKTQKAMTELEREYFIMAHELTKIKGVMKNGMR